MQFDEIRLLFQPMEPGSFAEARLAICDACEFKREVSKTCTKCNCVVPWKVRIPSQMCPEGKWRPEDS